MTNLNKSGIYKIVNKINGREYYGSAQKFKKRKNQHFNLLRRNDHYNPFLQRDFNKCGEENFEFKIILYCDEENLLFYEQRFLDKYWDNCNSCYNILPTAGSNLGRKLSEEVKQKLSEASKKMWENPKYKLKMSEAKKGNQHALGNKLSAEAKLKMSEVKKGKNLGKQNPYYDHTIYHFIHMSGIEEKCTQHDLRTKYNLDAGNLFNIIKGKGKSVKGWTFRDQYGQLKRKKEISR